MPVDAIPQTVEGAGGPQQTSDAFPPPSLRAVALPIPRTQRLCAAGIAERVGLLGMAFLRPVLDVDDIYALERSRTRVDVGLWWRHAPLWLILQSDAVHLVAWGRSTLGPRPWLQTVPLTAVQVTYNHVVGALVIQDRDDDETLPPPLGFDPVVGYQLWADITARCGQVD